MRKFVKNIPNLITISRIISCTLGATLFVSGNIPAAFVCYVYGAVSDAVDGFLARKLNAVTEFGKKLDPISDKLFALSLIAPAVILGNYFMIISLVLEGVISGVNTYAQVKYKKSYTEKIGKVKTIFLYPTMILGLLATQIPVAYLVFLLSFFMSTDLQVKSVMAYFDQLDKTKKEYESNLESNISNKDEKISLEKNKNNGVCNTNSINNIKSNKNNKIKKLVRKKDYNDRY